MKQILLIFIGLSMLSCNKKEIETKKVEINKVESFDTIISVNKVKYPFYDFDQIEYYKFNLTSDQEESLRKTDSIGFKILMQDFPKTVADPIFYGKLNQNYSLKKMSSKWNTIISEIYSEKFSGQFAYRACDAFYRDILIFKKKDKIVGVSKICFECELNWTIGSERNVDLLGQEGDYEKLKKILSKQ